MMKRMILLVVFCLVATLLAACGRLDVAIVEPTPEPGPDAVSDSATVDPGQADGEPVSTPVPTEGSSTDNQEPVTRPVVVTLVPTPDPNGQPTRVEPGVDDRETDSDSDQPGQDATVCAVRSDWPLYAVKSGDTLFRIARSAGATVDQLVKANCLADPDRLFAGQRLRVPQLPPDPPEPTPTTRPGPWSRHDDDVYQVSFDYPNTWRNVSDDLMTRLAGEDGWVRLAAAGAPAHLDTVASNEAFHKLRPYGSSPVIEPFGLPDGRPARLILPSADQPASMNGQAMVIAPYAEPILIGGVPHNYVMLAGDVNHIRDIGATLTLPPPINDLFIESFTVSDEDLDTGGKRLTFRWQARGANRGVISSGTSRRFAPWWPVESAGELIVDVQGTLYPDPVMSLRMVNDVTGQEATARVVLSWACEHSFFFQPGPEICPREAALAVDGAFQPFQRGFMIWLPRPDLALPSIYVFTEDGRVSLYQDTWTPDDPDNDLDETPPEGLYEPVGGFAKVWRENPSVRADLGWGIASEYLYRVSYQAEARESLPGVAYLTRPDGSMVRLLDTVWQVYVPGQDQPGVGGGPTP